MCCRILPGKYKIVFLLYFVIYCYEFPGFFAPLKTKKSSFIKNITKIYQER